jgi:hypothetical protein
MRQQPLKNAKYASGESYKNNTKIEHGKAGLPLGIELLTIDIKLLTE